MDIWQNVHVLIPRRFPEEVDRPKHGAGALGGTQNDAPAFRFLFNHARFVEPANVFARSGNIDFTSSRHLLDAH